MRKLLSFLVFACGLIWTARAEVRSITSEDFRREVFDYQNDTTWRFRGSKPCIVDFYTTWCGPCRRLAPIMDSLSTVYKGKVVFYKVDTDQQRDVARFFGINSIPQVLYVPAKGKPALYKGSAPADNIVQVIDEFLLGKKPKKTR